MPVHIQKIAAKQIGPIAAIEIEPALVTCIYGHNEKGKTHLVEFIIRTLFRKDRSWALRDQSGGGSIAVAGLGKETVSFSPGSSLKLEDLWEQKGTVLPADFSKVLVVKSGDLRLGNVTAGADKATVRKYLSHKELFDRIAERIPDNVRQTEITENGDIVNAPNRGDNKTRTALLEELERINRLFREIDERYAGGRMAVMTIRRRQIETGLALQLEAKQHQAFLAGREQQRLETGLQKIPERLLQEIGSDIRLLRQKEREVAEKRSQLQQAEAAAAHARWLKTACDIYAGALLPKRTVPILYGVIPAAAATVAAVVLTVLDLKIPVYISLAAATLFWSLLFRNLFTRMSPAGVAAETERVRREFQARFSKELSGLPELQERMDESARAAEVAHLLRQQLDGETRGLAALEEKISAAARRLAGEAVLPEEWEQTLQTKEQERMRLQDMLHATREALVRLGVPPEQYREKPPESAWDPEKAASLQRDLEALEKEIGGAEAQLKDLKLAVFRETGDSGDTWELQIQALREKRSRLSREARALTAGIIGGKIVYDALQNLQASEDEKLAEALCSSQIKAMLRTVTGRYSAVTLQGEDLAVSDGTDTYPLADLSTGARDQVMLAVRAGLARVLSGRDGMFLILDDAFQHADWERRGFLIDQILQLAEEGWQILYFTMDDHIRSLFADKAGPLGKRFLPLTLD
ncbi:hypothetical protein JXO52_07975 [bacterium]|nr:hypothetical protein [bacterium]